jgi:hypothetical protein
MDLMDLIEPIDFDIDDGDVLSTALGTETFIA